MAKKRPRESPETGPLLIRSLYTDQPLPTLAIRGVILTVVVAVLLELGRGRVVALLGRELAIWETLLMVLPLLALYRLYILWTVKDLYLFQHCLVSSGPGGTRTIKTEDVEAVLRKGDRVEIFLAGGASFTARPWPSCLRPCLHWAGTAVASRWHDRLERGETVPWLELDASQGAKSVRITADGLLLTEDGQPPEHLALEALRLRIGPNGCRIGTEQRPEIDIWAGNEHANLYSGYYLIERLRTGDPRLVQFLFN